MKKKGNDFEETLVNIHDSREMHAFLQSILTPKEYDELPTRMEIFRMLHAGTAQHAIAKKLGVGVATVTRGSKEMQKGNIQKTTWWQQLSSPKRG